MNYLRQSFMTLYRVFEDLENICSHMNIKEYITRIQNECIILINIIHNQNEQIKSQFLEIQALKAELEMNATIFERINNDVLHMRHSISQVSQPTYKKHIEELI